MSKSEILESVRQLSVQDRQDVLNYLWALNESDLVSSDDLSSEDRAALDEALACYHEQPGAGRPWREVVESLRSGHSS